MNLKTTFALLFLVAAGAGLWVGAHYYWPPQEPSRQTLEVLETALTPENLTRIQVKRDGQPILDLQRTGDAWALPGNWPTRQPEVRQLVDLLTNLRSRFTPLPLDNPAQYGLDKPAAVVVVQAGEKEYHLKFGEEPEGGAAGRFSRPTYLQLGDKPEAIRLAPGLVGLLSRPAEYYQQRRLFPAERAKKDEAAEKEEKLSAQQIAVEAPAGSYALTRHNGEWRLSMPVEDCVDPDKLRAILTSVPDVWAEQFVDPAKKGLAEYGLDKPEQTLRVVGVQGETRTLLIGKPARTKTRRVLRRFPPQPGFPPLPPQEVEVKEEFRYAKLQDNDQIFEINADKLKKLFVASAALRDARLARFHGDDARRIVIAREGREIVLVKEKEQWRLRQQPKDVPADADKVRELLDTLSFLEAREKDVIDPAEPKVHGLDRPSGTIQVTVEESQGEGEKKTTKAKEFTFVIGKYAAETKKLHVRVEPWKRVNAVDDGLNRLWQRSALAYRGRRLFDFAAADVRRIEAPGKFQLEQEKETWRLTAPARAEVDPRKAHQLAANLAGLEAVEFVSDQPKPEDLDKLYGLAQPALSVVLTPGQGDARKLLIGKPRGDKPEYFAKLADDPAVFVVKKEIRDALDQSGLAFLPLQIWRMQPGETITRVQRKDADTLTLERKGDAWEVVAPAEFPAASEAMQDFLRSLSPLQAERFAAYGDKLDLASFGLDKPAATISFSVAKPAKDQKEPAKIEEHVLILGKTVDRDAGSRYARFDNGPGIFTLNPNTAAKLMQSYLDFADPTLLRFAAGAVDAFQRKMDKEELEIAKKDGEWKLSKPAALKADGPALEELLGQLSNLRAVRVVAYQPKDLKPFGLDAPSAVFTFRAPQPLLFKLGKVVEKEHGDPARGDRYAMGEAAVVGVIPGELSRKLLAPPFFFRDRSMARFTDADQMSLERGPRKAAFRKVEGVWKMTAPLEAAAEEADLEDFLNTLARLRADEVAAEKADDKQYGFDRPQARWRLRLGDKEVLDLLIGNREKIQEEGKEKDGPRCYAQPAGSDLVFLLSAKTTAQALGEYRSRTVWPRFDAAQVEALRYRYARQPFTLEKRDNAWTVADKPEAKVDAQAVGETLDALARLKAERYVVDKDADLKLYGLEPPELTLEIQTRTGARVLQVGRTEGESQRYYARVPDAGRTEVFLLSESAAARIVRELKTFMAGGG